MENKEKKLEYLYRIPCFMFDMKGQLRPAAFMDMAQELAVQGAEQLEFDDKQLRPHNIVWILARMTVEFDNYPQRYDSVTLQTWHRGLNSLYFIRDYQAIGTDGKVAVRGTSSWILMDWTTRRVIRSDKLQGVIPPNPQCDEQAIRESSPKIVLPAGAVMEPAGSHTVVYSDVDYNGHANNAKYTAWALDCLDQEYVYRKQVKNIVINFNHEAAPGSTVDFMHYQTEDTHYLEGVCNGHQVFICRIIFEDRK